MTRLMLECAVRTALIALGTAGILRVLRVKSAGARHAAWVSVLGLMLLLPAWMAWGPKAPLHLLPAGAPVRVAAVAVEFAIPELVTAPAAAAPHRTASWNWLFLVYLAGTLPLLLRLAIGTVRAQSMIRSAENREGRLTSERCAAPITVGWLRPVVILPVGWRSWPAAQRDAVLAHEGEHVRRRDPLVEWLALLNRAIFWFHPLAWWLERRLNALAEEACDAAVLERGHDPFDYSGYLLQLARSVGQSGVRVSAIGMAMPGSSLPERIRQILTRGPAPRLSKVRAACLAVGCVTISALFGAASVDRQQPVPEPPQPPAPVAAPAPAPPPAPAAAPLPPAALFPAPAFAAEPAQAPLPPPAPPQVTPPLQAPPPPPATPPPESGKRMIALYFDVSSMNKDSLDRAIAGARKMVESQLRPEDQIAILTWNGSEVRVTEDFTPNRARLSGDLDYVEGYMTGVIGTRSMFDGLRQAAILLGKLRDKKALVYFTDGQTRQSMSTDEVQPAIDAAMAANVAFYAIDVRGLARLIAAGDKLSISVYDEPQFAGDFTVDANGMIAVKLAGSIKAAGLTVAELQTALAQRLMAYLKTPRVTVSFHQ